ncbi:serine/threonine-protein kinase Sgk2 [Xylaria scruposa]|nr:serine/threonine-protein kinase Sgk2 [Xylaria scruposa]
MHPESLLHMPLTNGQIDIISQYPLGGSLPRTCVSNLLFALQVAEAALNLYWLNGQSDVASALFSIRQLVKSHRVDLDQFRPLVRLVIDRSADIVIWAEVFRLLDDMPSWLLRNIPHSFYGTPVEKSSGRLVDSEEWEAALFQELKTCTYRNVEGFCQKFFNADNCGDGWEAMVEEIKKSHVKGRWVGFPDDPWEPQVWAWLRSLEDNLLTGAPYKLHTTKPRSEQSRKGQMDVFFRKPGMEGKTFTHKDVLVVGQQRWPYDRGSFKEDLLPLAHNVRDVFTDQPTRLFVHAFTLCGSTMELWIFDRSGAYSSGPFDIHEKPDMFARALAAYATMKEEAMGLDTRIKKEDGRLYIELDHPFPERIWLDKAIVRQKAIVSRGTTCYVTRDGNVAKFSWTSDKWPKEIEHLKLAEERGVKGVARLVAWGELSSIEMIRKGLTFPPQHYKFEHRIDNDLSYAGIRHGSSFNNAFVHACTSKRLQSISQTSNMFNNVGDQPAIGETKSSLRTHEENPWDNKTYTCLVVSPAGRLISDFRTMKELLESMRDAIEAHRSLYMTGDILHRDISPNNIIITDPKTANGFKGMLIDLDRAKIKNSPPSKERQPIGTLQFMAIEVMLGKIDHNYRHDLESFFYVLLWMCAHHAWDNGFTYEKRPFQSSCLRDWEDNDFGEIARLKTLSMNSDGIGYIIGQFPRAIDHCVSEFCLAIRQILFPLSYPSGKILIETPEDPNTLYGPILTAYDEIIKKL